MFMITSPTPTGPRTTGPASHSPSTQAVGSREHLLAGSTFSAKTNSGRPEALSPGLIQGPVLGVEWSAIHCAASGQKVWWAFELTARLSCPPSSDILLTSREQMRGTSPMVDSGVT